MLFLLNFILFFVIAYCQQNISDIIQDAEIQSYFTGKVKEILQNEDDNYSPLCRTQLEEYTSALFSFEPWALRMLDASGKIPSGILEGNMDMGSFDECLSIESPKKTLGQFCVGDIKVLRKSTLQHFIFDGTFREGVSRKALINRIQLKQTMCIPDGCSADALTLLFKKFSLNIKFLQENCQTKDSLPAIDLPAIIACSIFGIIATIILVSTIFHTYYHYTGQLRSTVWSAFSLLSNGKKFCSVSTNPDIITCLHGLRALSIVWVIVGHTYGRQMDYPVKNRLYAAKWILDLKNMYAMGGTVSVDTFFLISGIVVTYSYLLYTNKGKRFNIWFFYFHRYVRLTPAFAATILFQATLFKYMGSGPFWPITRVSVENPCKTNWWKALLYIQNYGDTNICFSQSWYLSVDTQLYMLSPIILLPLSRWPTFTLIVTGILTMLSMGACFLAGWVYELNGQLIANTENLIKLDNYFKYYYRPTHTRATVWLIGVICGYFLFKFKTKDFKLPYNKVTVFVLWAISLTIVCACVYTGHDLIFQSKSSNKLENSLYLAMMRPAWGVAVSWIVYACFTGYGGPVNWFLSLPFFELLAKLSYSMFLVHTIVIYAYLGQIRTALIFSDFNEMYIFWGNFAFTFIFSLILYLGVESPISLLEQRLLTKGGDDTQHIERNHFGNESKLKDDTNIP